MGWVGGAGEGPGIAEALGSGSRYGSQRGSKEAVPSSQAAAPSPELTGQVLSRVMRPLPYTRAPGPGDLARQGTSS